MHAEVSVSGSLHTFCCIYRGKRKVPAAAESPESAKENALQTTDR